MLKKFTSFIFLLFISSALLAQEKEPELETDRPNQTQSPKVVPKGTFQMETGLQFEKDKSELYNQKEFLYPTALFRIGLLKRGELRLGFDYDQERKKYLTGETKVEKGFHEVLVGAKFNLVANEGMVPEIGVLGNLTLPVGNPEFKPPHLAPEGRLLFSNKISEKLELQYNVGYRKEKVEEEYKGESLYTFTGNVKFTDKLTWFAEIFGQKPNGDVAEHSFDTGLLYKVLPNFQIDVAGGIGLNKQAPDAFVGGGLTWRIPK